MVQGSNAGEAGRSTAIVLFTDLVGSTEVRSRLGEQGAEEIRLRHDRLVAEAIQSNRGRLVKHLGDGVMATFTGASDAVAAAVRIQQALDRNNRSAASTEALEVRIGLSAGDVAVEKEDCFGTPVIEAARLCAAALGGQVLVSEVVRWLAGSTGGHQYLPVGTLELKGLPHGVPACEVAWEPLPQSSVPMQHLVTEVSRIFVGRERELERLGQLWKEVAGGERRVALLAGEPGVGKTRLAAALAAKVHDDGATVLAGRCDEDLGVPYQPFVEALRHFVDHTPPEALQACLGRFGGELARLVPELAEQAPDLPCPLRSDPETERYRLFDAVSAWLAATSADQPLLVILDDLQWAAKPTLLLLRHVVRSSINRLLILGTYRDTELTHDHPLAGIVGDLRREGGVERLSLSGLDGFDVAAFVEKAVGRTLDEDGIALARAIHEETEGNPFFVREVFRHLNETGVVDRREGRWASGLAVEQLGIPESVRDVVGRRLARLSEDANQALRAAAVAGAEFELPVVQAAGRFNEDTLLSAIEEATEAGLVISAAGSRYRFAHALVRDTIYAQVGDARRGALHRRTAEAIELLRADLIDDYLGALAHHYARAAAPAPMTRKALEYARRAGERALAGLAPDEAVAWFERASEIERKVSGGNLEERADLLIALGESQRQAGQASFRETLLEAGRLARQLGDTDRLVRSVLANNRGIFSRVGWVDGERVEMLEAAMAALRQDSDHSRALVLALLGAELTFSGDWPRLRNLFDEALAIARRSGDKLTLARVLTLRQMSLMMPETLPQRLAETAENVELAASLADPVNLFWAFGGRLRALLESGQFDEADRLLPEMDRLVEELHQPILRWFAGWHRFPRVYLTGRYQEAEQLALDALQHGNDGGHPDAFPVYGAHIAMIRLDQGRLGELVPLLEKVTADNPGVPSFRALLSVSYLEADRVDDALRVFASDAANQFSDISYDMSWAPALSLYAEVCVAVHDISAAEVLFEKLLPGAGLLTYTGATTWGGVDRYLGLLASTMGRFGDADTHFTAAARFHEGIGAPAWLARTHVDWARMLLARRENSDAARARELLGQALTTAREFGLVNVERRAVELLASL